MACLPLATDPSANTALTSTTLRWLGTFGGGGDLLVTPRACATTGALTKVMGSSRDGRIGHAKRRQIQHVDIADGGSSTSTLIEVGASVLMAPETPPGLRTTSSQGATSSSTAPPVMFGIGHRVSRQNQAHAQATSITGQSCASLVETQVRGDDDLQQVEER